MNVPVKTSGGITVMPLDTRLLSFRKVFLTTGEEMLNAAMADEFAKQILYLNLEDSLSPIDVIIDSHGGQITAGMLIYDVIHGSKAPVRLFCQNHAYSMAAILLASGTHGRYVFPNSEIMIHEPQLENHVSGTISTLRSYSEKLQDFRQLLYEILTRHTGKSEEEIARAMSYDHFFSPEEAVSFGLCDGIADFGMLLGGMNNVR